MSSEKAARKDATKSTVQALLSNVGPPPRQATADPAPAVSPPGPADPIPQQREEAPPEQEVAPAAAPRASRPKRAPAPKAGPKAASTPLRDQPVTQMRIPAALFERVRVAKAETGDTHEVWFLDAFDAVSDLLDEEYGPGPQRRTRMPVRRRRTRRPTGDLLVAYPLRFTDEELEVLHERAAELNPPSLADLVTTIVRLRLEQLEK